MEPSSKESSASEVILTQPSTGNIKVFSRFRPLNEKEKAMNSSSFIEFLSDNHTVIVNASDSPSGPLRFSYDYVFTPDSSQYLVYEIAAKSIVDSVMEGFNGTVFAYGQTSSGKTFTMTGPDIDDPDLQGIIPRMVRTVFENITSTDSHIEFTVKVSYCEIYMEKIKDLLDPEKNNLKIHEDRTRGIFIADITEEYVSCDEEVYEFMKLGTSNREVGATQMNEGSSRSHAIFMLTISQSNTLDLSAKTGKLYLVDLAGSEKVSKTGAEGKRLDEAKNINKSLSTLGLVIYSLTDAKSTHIPYRDSKLTRMLQDSLGGNSKTALIITCSPSLYNENETISTLRFGIRAKAIKNKPKINREYTIAELKLLLSKAQEELKLKERRLHILERSLKQSGIKVSDDNALMSSEPTEEQNQELRQDLEETKALLTSIRERVRELEKENNEKEDAIQGMEVIMLEYDSKFKEMQSDLISSRKKVDNLTEEVMRLISSKDTLQHEITTIRQQKINLEQLLNEKDVEIEQLKLADKLKNERPSELNRLHAQLNESQQHLTYQIDMNARLTQQIEDLSNQLNSYLAQEFHDINKIKQNIREEVLKTEQARWDVEKDMIFRDLKNRVDKVVRLEIELDDLKERYCRMERSMNSGERGLRKKVETLERNLEHISQLYQTTCFERADHLSEKQHYIRKCESLTHEVVALKTQVDILNVQMSQMKNNIDNLTSENNSLKLAGKMNLANRLRKTIRGGTSFLLGTSFLAGDKSRNQSMFMLPEEISEAPLTDR